MKTRPVSEIGGRSVITPSPPIPNFRSHRVRLKEYDVDGSFLSLLSCDSSMIMKSFPSASYFENTIFFIEEKTMNELAAKCKWVFVILFFSGCAHQLELSQQSMTRVETLAVNKSYWLKQSLYAGPFYDDDRFDLVHPNAFDELTYLKMPDGETIFPPPYEKIIPAGSR